VAGGGLGGKCWKVLCENDEWKGNREKPQKKHTSALKQKNGGKRRWGEEGEEVRGALKE